MYSVKHCEAKNREELETWLNTHAKEREIVAVLEKPKQYDAKNSLVTFVIILK